MRPLIGEMPSGIASVQVEEARENMIGSLLVVTTESGIVIKIDCLYLAEHEGNVGIYYEDKGESPNDMAQISFDNDLPTEMHMV